MSKSDFLISGIETGQLNAVVKNIMLQTGIIDPKEAVRLMNAGKLTVTINEPKWREENGIIYFSFTSYGLTGVEWIHRLERKQNRIDSIAKDIMASNNFQATTGVIYNVVILKNIFFDDRNRNIKKIRAYAQEKHLSVPALEIACMIRDQFNDLELQRMGLETIIVMHRPITDADGHHRLLSITSAYESALLHSLFLDEYDYLDHSYSFAFIVSQSLSA